MLAHELRNPLAPLSNALRLVERSGPLTERARQALAVAERQRVQLARLVDDLLEIDHISRRAIELRREPPIVQAAVQAAVAARWPRIEERSQRVALALPARPVRIVADPARLA